MQPRPQAAGAFTPIALVFLCGLVGGALVNLFIPVPVWPGNWTRIIGLAPVALGVGFFAWARTAFRRHQTALMPWSPSSALVQDGPYALSRNPIYLSFGMMYLGFSLVLNSLYILVMLVVVIVLFDRFQISREESYLQERFGDEFTEYKARVRRWL
jgi:protein-S-isoprenylcysteine O-methyltransferase Ste14